MGGFLFLNILREILWCSVTSNLTSRCLKSLQTHNEYIPVTIKAKLGHRFSVFTRKVTKIGYLYLYTIKLLSFNYISAKSEFVILYYKEIACPQKQQVGRKLLPLSTDEFLSGCL